MKKDICDDIDGLKLLLLCPDDMTGDHLADLVKIG
jgi:hypothetical protein